MKVSKCTPIGVPPPPEATVRGNALTSAPEGVYKCEASSLMRVVVLRSSNNSSSGVLFYNGSVLSPLDLVAWGEYKFTKIDAEVCFEIREKK